MEILILRDIHVQMLSIDCRSTALIPTLSPFMWTFLFSKKPHVLLNGLLCEQVTWSGFCSNWLTERAIQSSHAHSGLPSLPYFDYKNYFNVVWVHKMAKKRTWPVYILLTLPLISHACPHVQHGLLGSDTVNFFFISSSSSSSSSYFFF